MPWTLYRYILADLLRIIGLTTAVLVTVIAFGAAIKPLASDRLLDAAQTAKYIGLVIVPMLQFALPFAAGFGATLSFYRLSADNELQAMAASGISYRRILAPVLALGIVLTIFMIVLTQAVIPRFWAMIVQTIAEDVTRIFQVSIQRGEAFEVNNMQIFADRLVLQEYPEGPDGPATRMILLNVAAADLDADGRIVTDVTASQAIVDVYRRGTQTYLKMVMNDTVALNPQTGQLVYSERFAPRRAMALSPTSASKSLKPQTIGRLLQLRRNPDLHGPVAVARESLLDALRDASVRQAITERLRTEGRLELYDQSGAEPGSRKYVVFANRMTENGRFAAGAKPIEVVQYESGVPTVRLLAASVHLVSSSSEFEAPSFDLVLGDHDVINLQQTAGAINKRAELVISTVGVQESAEDGLEKLSSAELMDEIAQRPSVRPQLQALVDSLRKKIRDMYFEITARIVNRVALASTAFLLLMIGTLMAMWHRGGQPLVIYVWAFVPSVVDLILISAGEQLLRDGRMWGHGVMWSGNVILIGLCVFAYTKVSRN